MQHRHLNHERYTLAAIDDVISRGKLQDWIDLREEIIKNPTLIDGVERICHQYLSDPYAQRYHFWNNYVQSKKQQKSS